MFRFDVLFVNSHNFSRQQPGQQIFSFHTHGIPLRKTVGLLMIINS